jgi:predicted alpha/beta superfamily hydrolase
MKIGHLLHSMKNILSIFLVLVVSHFAKAQAADGASTSKKIFPFGVIEEFHSQAIGEQRVLNIYLPDGYHSDSSATYPVVYVLDGSAHEDFPHIAGLVQFMNMYDLMPKSIVVGIANVNRYRDFTFPSKVKEDKKINPANGGAEKFLHFLENEVQPLVAKNYRINQHQTIIGQSLGGLLATEILMKKPYLFDDYIIVSPSLWWNDQRLVDSAAAYFKENQNLEKKLFISLGKEHPVMHEVADKLVKAIRDSGNEKLTLYYQPILDEDHATILHIAVYRAFKKLNEKEGK